MRKYMVFIHGTAREYTRSTTKYITANLSRALPFQKSYFFLTIYEFEGFFGSDVQNDTTVIEFCRFCHFQFTVNKKNKHIIGGSGLAPCAMWVQVIPTARTRKTYLKDQHLKGKL